MRAEAEHGGGVQSVVAVALPSPALPLRRLRPNAMEEEDGRRERATGEDERGEEARRQGGGLALGGPPAGRTRANVGRAANREERESRREREILMTRI